MSTFQYFVLIDSVGYGIVQNSMAPFHTTTGVSAEYYNHEWCDCGILDLHAMYIECQMSLV